MRQQLWPGARMTARLVGASAVRTSACGSGMRMARATAALCRSCARRLQQPHRRRGFLHNLLHGALLRRLVRTPAQELGPVSKAACAEVVVLHFYHEMSGQWLPVPTTLAAPAAGPTGALSSEAGRFDERLKLR